jgi:hypothetical protein
VISVITPIGDAPCAVSTIARPSSATPADTAVAIIIPLLRLPA